MVLRKDILTALDMPLELVHGRIGSLQITVPWSNLKNKPVIVAVRDVHIIIRPKGDVTALDAESQRRVENSRKQVKLAMHEELAAQQRAAMLAAGGSGASTTTTAAAAAAAAATNLELNARQTEAAAAAKAAAENTFYAKLVTKIIDNLQITIDDVHIRYEDDMSDPTHPFACGITLERASAQSCNETWQPAFVADEAAVVRKRVRLQQFAIYWTADSELLSQRLQQRDIGPRLNAFIARTNDVPVNLHYILAPVRASLKVCLCFPLLFFSKFFHDNSNFYTKMLINKGATSATVPFQTFDVLLERIDMTVEDVQYRDLTKFVCILFLLFLISQQQIICWKQIVSWIGCKDIQGDNDTVHLDQLKNLLLTIFLYLCC